MALGLALTFVLAPSFTPTGHVDIAHAKSAKKKVEFGLKIVGKGLAKVEKAGKAAQKKRGIVGKAGGILKNAAKGGEKGVKWAEKGIGKVTKGANRLIGKSKLGRAAQKGYAPDPGVPRALGSLRERRNRNTADPGPQRIRAMMRARSTPTVRPRAPTSDLSDVGS